MSCNKCIITYVGITECKLNLSLNSNALPVGDEVKYLGVFVDSHLTFYSHFDNVVARAFTRSNLILKCVVLCDVTTLMRALTVYASFLLEYASYV